MGGKSSKEDILLAAIDRLHETLDASVARIGSLEEKLDKLAVGIATQSAQSPKRRPGRAR